MKTDKIKRFIDQLEQSTIHNPARFTKENFHEAMCELYAFHSEGNLWFASIKEMSCALIIKVEEHRDSSMSTQTYFRVVDYSLIPMNSFASAIVAISGNTNNYEAILNILKGNEPEKGGKDIGDEFEKEFATKTDYFNHRGGLMEEIKIWLRNYPFIKPSPGEPEREGKTISEDKIIELLDDWKEWASKSPETRQRTIQRIKRLFHAKPSPPLKPLSEIRRNIYFEFDNETPNVGDKIIKVFHETKDSPLGTVKTIIEDNKPTNYHMKCSDGFGYNKIAEHGWRRLVKIGYDSYPIPSVKEKGGDK